MSTKCTRLFLLPLILLVLSACDDPAPEEPPPPATPDIAFDASRIPLQEWESYWTGFVRIDELVAQVVDPDGAPVPGARAILLAIPAEQILAPVEIAETRTDERGVFRLTDVPADFYISIEADGWAGRLKSVRSFPPASQEPVQLRLRRGADLEGTVRKVDGTPVEGVRLISSTPEGDWIGRAVSASEGTYRIPMAPAGRVTVGVLADRYMGRMEHVDVEAGTPASLDLTVVGALPVEGIVLEEGTQVPIGGALIRSMSLGRRLTVADEAGKFRLETAHGDVAFVFAPGYAESVIHLDPMRTESQKFTVVLGSAASAMGRVETPEGEPIEDARILVVGDPDGRGTVFRGPRTREDGKFLYNWIPEPPGDHSAYFVAITRDRLAAIGKRHIAIKGVRIPDEIVLRPELPVNAHVRIVDDEGEPLVGARASLRFDVEAYPNALRFYLGNADGGPTDEDGRVHLRGLRPGPQILEVAFERRAPFTVRMELGEEPEQDLGDVVVPTLGRIAGRITSTGGEVPDDHRLDLIEVGGRFRLPGELSDDGSFEFWGLSDKNYMLRVGAVGHATVERPVKIGQTDVEIILQLLGTLVVAVGDSDGSESGGVIQLVRLPASGAAKPRVQAFPRTGEEIQIDRLTPGSYALRVELDDRSRYGVERVRVRPGQSETVSVPLKKAGTLYGTVHRPDGTPASDVTITYHGGEFWGARSVRTDSDGHYRLPGVPEGRLVLSCHPFGCTPVETEVEMGPGEEIERDVKLSAGVRLSLSVTDRASGAPVEGVSVGLGGEDGTPARFWVTTRGVASTDKAGELTLIGIRPGEYRLTLFLDSVRLESRAIVLTEDRDLSITVDR